MLSNPSSRAIGDQVARLLERLNPVHRFLHLELEILNPHAQPVEAHLAHRLQVRARGYSRVHFDPDLRVRRKREALPRVREQVLDLLRRKVGRRSTAPMKLRHLAFARNAMADVVGLFFQNVQIRRRNSLVLLDDHIARTEKAQALAEGKMHVQRNRAALFLRRGQRLFVFLWPKGVGPHRRRGIAGVARSRLVVAIHKLFAHGEFIAHLPQAWIHQCHGASLPRDQERDFPAWLGFRQCRLLPGLYEQLRIFHGCVRQNAMPQIQYVAAPAKLSGEFQRGLPDFLWRRREHRWIEITLHGHARPRQFADFRERNPPIHAQNIRARAHNRREQVVRRLGVVNHGHRSAQPGNYLLHNRQHEFRVIVQIQFAAPGVEQLHRADSRGNLPLQVKNGRLGDLAQQLPKNLRLAIKKFLHRREAFLRPPFYHVARQRPGRSREAQHRYVRPGLLHSSPQRLHQEPSLHVRIEQVQFPDVRLGAHRLGQVRPGIAQLQGQAHRFRGDQNVRKNDDRVHPQPPEGLQRHFHGQVRRLADLQKRMFCPDLRGIPAGSAPLASSSTREDAAQVRNAQLAGTVLSGSMPRPE